MGGGNAAKSIAARERNAAQAKAKAGGVSQTKQNAAAMNIQCVTCMATFLCTSTDSKLKEHSDNKHPKKTFLDRGCGGAKDITA
ncbi:hypothetical protein FOA52_011066 [Chlamydomonas sp. UWO 241]|nr:hypothetical protein FOA52_011066 [Chlamydomonas sp. UWO 241]